MASLKGISPSCSTLFVFFRYLKNVVTRKVSHILTEELTPTKPTVVLGDTMSPAYTTTPHHDREAPPCLAGIAIYAEAQKEYDLIKKTHRTLAPTGCAPDFCQSGRMTRLNETRVGRDRPLAEVQQEAMDFLRECRDQNVIESDQLLDQRIKTALVQIMEASEEKVVTDVQGRQFTGIAGGIWEQTYEELEYGLRAAWRNSRRCIMRSEHMHLALHDLRHVTTSREMVNSILNGMVKAFNRGRIVPTCFVFPPRLPGRRGPMVWNSQIIQFAGYRQDDGSVLGDPASVDLTEAFIEFGWKPPRERTRWDILPLIAMADGDQPCMSELPPDLRRTISITHPRFEREFQEMDMRWVMAPALSRQGFDIGGIQYTGTPFIGWFMDSEIGVRDLADTFRYNMLPEVAERCGLSDEPETPFDQLPEYLALVALSRAQAELNFAVYYSFLRGHVTMVDTLTGSMKYMNYDLDWKDATGHRLPADPYWLAPPQGSIVPIWHQGGSPNYQPKPMICRHVQDPIKAWKREVQRQRSKESQVLVLKSNKIEEVPPRIKILFCSSGKNASKMARKLYDMLERLIQDTHDIFVLDAEKPLNTLSLDEVTVRDVVLIIASTTGSGVIPSNAAKFIKKYSLERRPLKDAPRFSVFANGDSTYGDTYNAAAKRIQKVMISMGCQPLMGHCFAGDTANHTPDWESFHHWVDNITHLFLGSVNKIDLPTGLEHMGDKTTALRDMPFATLIKKYRPHPDGMVQVTFDIGNLKYREMDHLKLLAPNPRSEVRRALKALGLQEETRFTWHHEEAFSFLCRFVDLARPFKSLRWHPQWTTLNEQERKELSSLQVCDLLDKVDFAWTDSLIEQACKDMGSIQPRLYSVASCQRYSSQGLSNIAEEPERNLVDIVVKVNDMGKFSDIWLLQAPIGAKARLGHASPDTWRLLRAQRPDAPFIAIATGSGLGPVRSVLESRMSDLEWTSGLASSTQPNAEIDKPRSQQSSRRSSFESLAVGERYMTRLINHHAYLGMSNTSGFIHLFAGFKKEDELLVHHLIQPAVKAGTFGTLELVPSNPDKIRVQDRLLANKETLIKLLKESDCIVFVCANESAADAAEKKLDEILGTSIRMEFGERYIEEVFRSHHDG